jgi:hypothetical protein
MSKLRSAQKSGSLMISLQARQFASDRKSPDCVKEEKIEVATPRISNTRIRRWYKNPSFLLRPTSFLCCLFFTCKYHISITIQEKSKLESKIVFRLSSACGFVQFLHTETYIFVLWVIRRRIHRHFFHSVILCVFLTRRYLISSTIQGKSKLKSKIETQKM